MFKLYKKYLKKYRKQVILGPIFKLVEAIFELLVPLVIANMINNGLNNQTLTPDEKVNYILSQGGFLLLFTVIGLCSTLVCQFFASRASQGFGTILRDELFTHINSLSFKELDKFNASSLLTIMNSDINNMQQSVAMLIRLVVRAPFLVIGATIMSFTVSIKAGLIFLVTGISLFIVIITIMFYTIPKNKKAQKKLDTVTTIAKENLSGNRVIRAFNRQKSEFVRFVDESVNLKDILVRIGRINALLNPLTFIIANIAVVVVLYLGSFDFVNGNLNQGNIQALVNYLTQIQLAVMVVANLVVIFTKAAASASRINEVFATTSSIVEGNEKEGLDFQNIIEFDQVDFAYHDNGQLALKNLSFKIAQGMTIGIIGGTGSGKSSIVNVLNRFYDVTNGSIKLYGRNIKDYQLAFVQSHIATVHQNAVLFSSTVKENLTWGNESASLELINQALQISQAKEFVENLDKGLDSVIYQGGKNLSGGQKQRLSIARALVKDSDILILDDSSSALDYKTDLALRRSLKKLAKTIILISQRASTIMHADLILVLDKGYLVGKGTHEYLKNNCPIYKEICESQDTKEEKL